MSISEITLPDLDAMATYGGGIAARLKPGDVVALSGPLGAGKTTLARSIIAALGHEGEVPSPTFTIIETYSCPPLRIAVVHADFYRLEDPSELQEIGLEDYRDDAALIAEWPQRAGGFAQEPGCLAIELKALAQGKSEGRIAIARAGADWLGRIP